MNIHNHIQHTLLAVAVDVHVVTRRTLTRARTSWTFSKGNCTFRSWITTLP